MKLIARFLVIASLGWLMAVLFFHAKEHMAAENADPTQTIIYFGSIVLVGCVLGAIAALHLLPAFGEWAGGFLFNPSVEVEKDPHASAMALMAKGDFVEAIEEYRRIFDADTSDTLALTEMARIYCDKLGDPESGATVLETALAHEWAPEQSALLCNRLADIYLNYFKDADRARAVLQQIAETMPNTKHAANAVHRLHEIDRLALKGTK